MTERLYLADPYLTRFEARVIAVRSVRGRPALVLDRSAFYPEGGGQPGDRGRLGEAEVVDTQEQDGEVLHVLGGASDGNASAAGAGGEPAAPALAGLSAGALVQGALDWARRFDHMQQHHGQHLLSAAFERVHGAATVSFHLGERTCTIDLDCSISKLDAPALRAAEASANQSVWADHPVIARDFTGDERARLPLRKEAVKGDRVVLVEGVDASPCGGTHPRRTGEVGSIAALRVQRWGQGQARIEFACGARVVRLLLEAEERVLRAAEALKSAPADVAEAAVRTVADSQARRKQLELLEGELAAHEAAALVRAHPEGPIAAQVQRGAGFARAVAAALSGQGRIALIASVHEGRAWLCFARPKATGSGPAMNALLKESLALIGGKGGGSPELAQGSGDPVHLADALDTALRGLTG